MAARAGAKTPAAKGPLASAAAAMAGTRAAGAPITPDAEKFVKLQKKKSDIDGSAMSSGAELGVNKSILGSIKM